MFAVPDTGPRPNCADPAVLPLVDEAFARPGGPAARRMRDELCTGCPVGPACLAWAMTSHEHGVWAGTSPNLRTRHGAPPSQKTQSNRRKGDKTAAA